MDQDERPGQMPNIGALLYTRHTLAMTLCGVVYICVVLATANVINVWRSGTMRYTTLGAGVQVSRPGEVPDAALRQFSVEVVRTLGNVNSHGIDAAIATVKRVMTGQFRVQFDLMMASDLEVMRTSDITMLTQNIVVTDIKEAKKGLTTVYQAFLTADRYLQVGDMAFPPQQVTLMVESYPVVFEHAGTGGLWVNDMQWTPLRLAHEAPITEDQNSKSSRTAKRGAIKR